MDYTNYQNASARKEPGDSTSTDKLKMEAVDKMSKNLIDSFPPFEIANILKDVKKQIQAHFQLRIEGAKQDVERMIKEADPLFNL